jgi:hypothetical protein
METSTLPCRSTKRKADDDSEDDKSEPQVVGKEAACKYENQLQQDALELDNIDISEIKFLNPIHYSNYHGYFKISFRDKIYAMKVVRFFLCFLSIMHKEINAT